VAILVALSLTGLLVVTAMVLDFGLVRIDRQIDRSAADAATLAGLHGLNTGDGVPHPYAGVCTAVKYLQANSDRFTGINTSSGWSNGLGAAQADGCSNIALRNITCKPGDKSSWAKWHWVGTVDGVGLDVTIQSGYDLAANQWQEDALTATHGDNGDPAYAGCDQLAVTIAQHRKPGLGSLATSSDLSTAIRSVGRVKPVPGDSAPAMLLLKRTGCPVLKTGSSGGSSFVHVEGAIAPNGKTQPGTIHSDSDGVGCNGSNNGWVYGGLANNGITAYAAPLASNPTAADPTKPGSVTSVAAANGITGTPIRDSLNFVYGSTALNGTGGAKTEVTGRSLVTRRLVDERFFDGVRPAIGGANTVFASGASGPPAGWAKFPASVPDPCKPTQANINALALGVNDKLYIDCNGRFVGDNGGLTFNAGTIYFRGWVNASGPVRLQNAHHVYIGSKDSSGSAISLGTGAEFQMHTNGFTDATGNCTTGQNSGKAVLFVRDGQFKETSGLLRMCRTTVMMMGGSTTGCVPTLAGTAPNLLTPCGGLGTGQFTQTGGGIDWTAPDTMDATTDPATGDPLPSAIIAWHDVNGMEDLALWSESGSNSSTNFSMTGGGLFRVRGVFMVPNAGPFIISGGASLNLTNAQYVASSIELNGSGTNITMRVDPNAAVTLPDQGLVGLVR
jgi:hypothetical protein